ncbi:hypothetical protein [Yoonia sediminilitoris]|uniref:Uncharacterized protein n=1 Tax=Yoonia sediminilitoris TaxID=1286148 RepID=A0A2T6KDT6_9RHOB|nr:hypothetical protein [Yoonia sediminilitoris]PUB13147.1 hypothetical protein C8N45_10867 [Yoonia sediminilitoris]RCW94482.1 hypothetical protein DFP92_10868 [Yoonia sediminilitoris]
MSNANVSVNRRQQLAKPSTFSVEDTYWGYIVRSGRGPSLGVMASQAVSFFLGACFLTACFSILLLPTLMFDGDIGVFRVGAATLFGTIAIYLLWFASRGSRTELHVDNSVGEIREVICNRAGKPTTIGCYGFDAIGGVFLDYNERIGMHSLVLRYRNTVQTVPVAEGTEAQLIGLRDRLGQDLMVVPQSSASVAA